MKKICLLPSILFFCFYNSKAQAITANSQLKKKIDSYLTKEMKAEQIPGLSYAVVLNGKIIDSGAYGLANVELNAPVNSHSLFNIGSIGKTFTATAIMLLQKDGKLSLNDPINKYLDSLPETWNKITIKHLLTHTSGIKDYAHDFPGYSYIEKDRKQEITEARFIRMATTVPLNFEPGDRWAYSNSNFVLLGFIIHKLSGKPIGEFMKEKIFQPAGMMETRYTSVTTIIPHRSTGYLLDDNDKLINGEYVSNFFSAMGDMGILTTATDLAKWCIAQDHATILDKQTLQQMWTPAKMNNGAEATGILGFNYGMGWGLSDHRGFKEIGHGGSFINGYTAALMRFPEKNIAVVVLTNINPSDVDWIALHISGYFDPELKGIDQLEPDKNADTSFNQKIYELFESFSSERYDTRLVTDQFGRRINPITKMIFSNKPNLTFIHTDKFDKKHLERFGEIVSKINYYKIQDRNETHYLAIYLTADNKITDMRGY